MVMKQGVGLVAVGLGIGTVGALGLTRVIQTMLFEVSATDPVTYVVVAALLLVVGIAACLVPARRATRVEAVSVLTTE
jgi:ABC-type antimicrobial peptide transport system permease subunit